MGLFSWLFGSASKVPIADRIWLTDAALHRGLLRDVEHHLRVGPVLVLAHFPDTLAAVRADLDTKAILHAPFPANMTPEQYLRAAETPGPLLLTGLVRDLRPSVFPDPAGDRVLPIAVAERHPLRKHDDVVVTFAEQLGRGPVTFHSSLDAPLMALFAGEWVKSVLQRLGVQDDEAIESAMVARRIKAAQDKVAARVGEEREADSAAAWLQANLVGG